jgi:hypothetical protein
MKTTLTIKSFENSIKLTGKDREKAVADFKRCKTEKEKENLLKKCGFFQVKNLTTK